MNKTGRKLLEYRVWAGKLMSDSQEVSEELGKLLKIKTGWTYYLAIHDAIMKQLQHHGVAFLGFYQNDVNAASHDIRVQRIHKFLEWRDHFRNQLIQYGYQDIILFDLYAQKYLYSRLVPEHVKLLFSRYSKKAAIIQLKKKISKEMENFIKDSGFKDVKFSESRKAIAFMNKDELNVFSLIFGDKCEMTPIYLEKYAEPIDEIIEQYEKEKHHG